MLDRAQCTTLEQHQTLASYPGTGIFSRNGRKSNGPGINCMRICLINDANLARNHSVVIDSITFGNGLEAGVSLRVALKNRKFAAVV